MLYGIPKDKYPCDDDKAKKKELVNKIPLLSTNQKTAFIYKVELGLISTDVVTTKMMRLE